MCWSSVTEIGVCMLEVGSHREVDEMQETKLVRWKAWVRAGEVERKVPVGTWRGACG